MDNKEKNSQKAGDTIEKKNIFKNFFPENKYILLTFLIGLCIITFTYALLLYYPFGDNTILKVDLYHQYAPFHEELRSKLLSGASLSYSWESGLGKELISQIAYYTASPISLLMLFFNQEHLSEAMALFAMLKIAAAGGFFAYYLKKVHNVNDLKITVFGILYAFMSFLTSYYWNIMWLDAVALFPLVALGIERVVKEEKFIFYTVALAISVFVNFYIAFIVCIFSALYFLVQLFSSYSWKKDRKIIIRRFVTFAVSSIIGGCIAMIMILPTAIALSQTQASDSNFPSLKMYANVWQLLENNFLGARPVVLGRNEDLPNIYSGLLTVILLPFYFANKRIKTKEKVLFGALLIFIYACSCVNVLDYLIHGMHFPSNLPHRYAFIYSFIVISLAFRAFLDIKSIKMEYVILTCVVYALILIFSEYVIVPNVEDIERVFKDSTVILNIVLMVVYCVILYGYKSAKEADRSGVCVILLVLAIVEGITSSITGLSDRMSWTETSKEVLEQNGYDATWTEKLLGGKYSGSTSRSGYVKNIDGINAALDYVKANDKDENKFHRTELRRFKAINSGSLYHYNGVSLFSSLAYGNTSGAMEKIGIAATSNSYRYYDPTPLFNALFNVKYIISTDNEIVNPVYKFIDGFGAETDSKTGEVKENDAFLYENEKALSLGFMVNDKVKDWDMEEGNPFTIQNNFLKLATGKEFNYLPHLKVTDLEYKCITINEGNKEEEEKKNKRYENGEVYNYKYQLEAPYDLATRVPEVMAKIYNDKEQRVFLYVNSGNTKQVSYNYPGCESNGAYNRDFSTGSGFVDLGIVPADCTIDVSFKLDSRGEFEKTYRKSGDFSIFACTYDENVFNEAYKLLADECLVVDDYGDDYVHGKINAVKDGIMFTSIPYDEGWELMVDGEKKDYISVANDGFIGVELDKGEHEIYFKYKPKGVVSGGIVSLVAIGAFVFFIKRGKILK